MLRDILGNAALTRTANIVSLKEYLGGWRMSNRKNILMVGGRQKSMIVGAAYFRFNSGRFTASQSCALSPQSSPVIHHNHSVAEKVVNLREKNLNAPRLTRLVNPGLLTSTTRKRVCIRPPESSLASNCAVPLFLT